MITTVAAHKRAWLLERVRIRGRFANAFDHTFPWALLIAHLTIIPAAPLVHAERTSQRQAPAAARNRREQAESAAGPRPPDYAVSCHGLCVYVIRKPPVAATVNAPQPQGASWHLADASNR